MFGMNYEEIGSKDKGLILKSSGKIKIQWGNKFIDLIDSDGNINSKALEFIKSISSQDEMTSDGFYFLDDSLYVKAGGTKFQILSDYSKSYINYTLEQELNSELKELVLRNIGFIYDSKNDSNVYPENGLIYFLDTKKLYKSVDKQISEYNPEYDVINISKNGKINFLDSLIESTNSNINYKSKYHSFYSNNNLLFRITPDEVSALNGGFRIYNYDGKTTLKVDSIIGEDNNNILDILAYLNKDNKLEVSYTNRNILSDGDSLEIQINSNSIWYIYVSDDEFLIDDKGIGNLTVTLYCPPNPYSENRNVTISIKDIYYDRLVELFPDDSNMLEKHYKVIELLQLGST